MLYLGYSSSSSYCLGWSSSDKLLIASRLNYSSKTFAFEQDSWRKWIYPKSLIMLMVGVFEKSTNWVEIMWGASDVLSSNFPPPHPCLLWPDWKNSQHFWAGWVAFYVSSPCRTINSNTSKYSPKAQVLLWENWTQVLGTLETSLWLQEQRAGGG